MRAPNGHDQRERPVTSVVFEAFAGRAPLIIEYVDSTSSWRAFRSIVVKRLRRCWSSRERTQTNCRRYHSRNFFGRFCHGDNVRRACISIPP